jgi:hypothetical protein
MNWWFSPAGLRAGVGRGVCPERATFRRVAASSEGAQAMAGGSIGAVAGSALHLPRPERPG